MPHVSANRSGVRIYSISLDLTNDGRDEILVFAPPATRVFDPAKPERGTMEWEDFHV